MRGRGGVGRQWEICLGSERSLGHKGALGSEGSEVNWGSLWSVGSERSLSRGPGTKVSLRS